MRALILNAEVCRAIDAAVDAARANPIPWETFKQAMGNIDQNTVTLPLKDRPADFKPPGCSQHVMIPMGVRAAISVEDQPAGLVRHLSISVESETDGMPNMPSVLAIAAAFGFSMGKGLESFDRAWTEEYDPGKWAINLLQLVHEREAPTETPQ